MGPGQHLFEYRDEKNAVHAVSSSDVNEYLKEISGRDITAKDFRTWAGTVKAALRLSRIVQKAPANRLLRSVIRSVAEDLGNTAAICRRCYIHPSVIAAFGAGALHLRIPKKGKKGLSREEIAVIKLLRTPSLPQK